MSTAGPLPVELFSERPQIGAIELSPDGTRVAVLGEVGKGGYGLYLVEPETSKARQLLRPEGRWVRSLEWIDERWLLVSTADEYGSWTGNVRIDTAATEVKPVGGQLASRCSYLDIAHAPVRRQGVTWLSCWTRRGLQLIEQDLSTDEHEEVIEEKEIQQYWLDHDGAIRAGFSCEEFAEVQTCAMHYRDPGAERFEVVARWDTGAPGAVWPAFFARDGKTLYVYAAPDGGTVGLYRWDTVTRQTSAPLFHHPSFDARGLVIEPGSRSLVGIRYNDGLPRVHWLDPKLGELDAEIRALFPDENTRVSFSDGGRRALVFVYSDRNPGEWHLYIPEQRQLRFLAKRNPKIDPEVMATERPVQYRARDGLTIHGYLTVPHGTTGRNLPLIVNPHGGPFGLRDDWGFDHETQFLASRGYAVLKINFRGSGGHGLAFERAGWGEWGLKMQDDISDGVAWAVEQGVADPGRICIYGASYGGYAALMGLIKTPDLYRCGVSYVGVSDLVKLLRDGMRGTGHAQFTRERRAWFKRVIGGRWDDKEALSSVSPLHQVRRIRAPLFVVHGKLDPIVPYPHHAYDFVSALKEAGQQPEVLYEDKEGHGFQKPENVRNLYLRLERFFARHLASPAPAAAISQ